MCIRSRASYYSGLRLMMSMAFCMLKVICGQAGELLSPDELGDRVYVYRDGDRDELFRPSGWMPDGGGIALKTRESDKPQSGRYCMRVGCDLSAGPWVGIYFLPEGKWEPKQRFDLLEKLRAKKGDPVKCRFWARSRDGAWVQFKVGGVGRGPVSDSLMFPAATSWVKLGADWKMYEIDLTGKDLSSVVGAFAWVCDRGHNATDGFQFDLDTIYFVRIKAGPKTRD